MRRDGFRTTGGFLNDRDHALRVVPRSRERFLNFQDHALWKIIQNGPIEIREGIPSTMSTTNFIPNGPWVMGREDFGSED